VQFQTGKGGSTINKAPGGKEGPEKESVSSQRRIPAMGEEKKRIGRPVYQGEKFTINQLQERGTEKEELVSRPS